MNKNIHIALDLDKTLAYYESKWRAKKVGAPIPPMVDKVKLWLSKGYKVTIFSARMSHTGEELATQIHLIQRFLFEAGLPNLEKTAIKRMEFTHFIDDKAFHVEPNTGLIVNCPSELL